MALEFLLLSLFAHNHCNHHQTCSVPLPEINLLLLLTATYALPAAQGCPTPLLNMANASIAPQGITSTAQSEPRPWYRQPLLTWTLCGGAWILFVLQVGATSGNSLVAPCTVGGHGVRRVVGYYIIGMPILCVKWNML